MGCVSRKNRKSAKHEVLRASVVEQQNLKLLKLAMLTQKIAHIGIIKTNALLTNH